MTEQLVPFDDGELKECILGLMHDFFLCACNIHVIGLRDYFACILVCFNILHVAVCVRDVIIVGVCPGTSSYVMCVVKIASSYILITSVVGSC